MTWSCLGDVKETVLIEVVSCGLLEDVVSKERVSSVFGVATNKALQKIKTVRTKTNQLDLGVAWYNRGTYSDKCRVTFGLVKKMPKLVDGIFMRRWRKDQVEQLASINQSLKRFDYDTFKHRKVPQISKIARNRVQKNIITYVAAAKAVDPTYTAEKIDFEFELNDEIVYLLAEHPGLKIKMSSRSCLVNHSVFKKCPHLYLDRKLDASKSYDHVKRVTIGLDSDYKDTDIRLLSNVEDLVFCGSESIRIYPHIVSRLKRVDLKGDFRKKDVLDMINTHPLETLVLEWGIDKEQIIEAILSSPMNTLQNFKLIYKDDECGHRATPYSLMEGVLEASARSHKEVKIVEKTLMKFPNIHTVKVYNGYDLAPKVKKACREIEQTNRRRSIKVIEMNF